MQTYHYDETAHEYTHSEQAFLDPLESKQQGKSVYLLPANATFIAPTHKDGYATIWNGEAWEHIEDNRGKEYWFDTDEYGTPAKKMETLGVLPANAVLTAPTKTLEQVKVEKITSLKADRERLEVEDITVDGNTFDYDEKARERINNAIIALQASGVSIHWTLADHQSTEVTAEDLIKVVSAVAIRSNVLHVAYRKAKEEVLNAETEDEVNAVELEVTDA